MRVLFAANPEKTIFQYLAPLAWALRTAGHEVRVASQPRFTDIITQAGLTAVPVGRDRDLRMARPGELEAERAGIPSPYDAFDTPEKANWEYLKPAMATSGLEWHKYGNFPIVAGLVEFARSWRPDLVIWEPLCFAGPIAAAACGATHARLLFGVDVFAGVRELYRRLNARRPPAEQADPLADWFTGYARKYDFDFTEELFTGQFTIDQFPRCLQVEADLRYERMQYIPYGGRAVVPRWLWPPPARPRVALTMGLSATEVYSGYNVPLPEIFAALADLDIELVATVAESQQHKLGRTPDNTRVVSYVPWHALAPSCSAVVHHAGAATLATTARWAVPQLCLHYHYDQPTLARKLTAQGAGLEIHTSQVTGEKVRDAVQQLLTESSYRKCAEELRDEIHATPTPNELVPRLAELVGDHR
ncbi:activator-dependent family glycosyltransferase [Amycolatopsis lurida]